MNAQQASTHVTDALRDVVPDADPSTLRPGEQLREALELDSLDFLNFVERLSALTGLRIDEQDYPRLSTYEDCVRFVEAAAVAT